MSTYMYLECRDHEPPLLADAESGQHHYDLPRIRDEIASRDQVAEEYESGDLWRAYERMESQHPDAAAVYFRRNSGAFLSRHLTCRIGIRDEYGVDRTEPEP